MVLRGQMARVPVLPLARNLGDSYSVNPPGSVLSLDAQIGIARASLGFVQHSSLISRLICPGSKYLPSPKCEAGLWALGIVW